VKWQVTGILASLPLLMRKADFYKVIYTVNEITDHGHFEMYLKPVLYITSYVIVSKSMLTCCIQWFCFLILAVFH